LIVNLANSGSILSDLKDKKDDRVKSWALPPFGASGEPSTSHALAGLLDARNLLPDDGVAGRAA
jgi:hypothetical protein